MRLWGKKRNSLFRSNRMKSLRHEPINDDGPESLISANLHENLQLLCSIYSDCSDVIYRKFLIGGRIKACLVYIEGLINIDLIDKCVLAPLMEEEKELDDIPSFMERKIRVTDLKQVRTYADCVKQISAGNPVLLIEGERLGSSMGLAMWEHRAVQEPTAEAVVRGPREGFIETLRVNTSLLRRKIRSPQLKIVTLSIGRYTMTEIAIAYIEGLVDQTLLEEVLNRLRRIDIDGVMESSYIEEMIEDNTFSLFPQTLNTERPDVTAANLLEGRVAILMDGTPFALIVPTTLYSLLQSPEDYYQRYLFSSAIRWLRYGALIISILLPSLYVAVLTFHQEMIPTSLFLSVAKSREEIPFPVVVEALIMEVTFEALREAGVRLPKQIGAAVSIVGALVIGQAAVSAGIVSAPMVMVVAITGISSFMIPRYSMGIALRLLRFPVMLLAGMMGLLGVMMAVIAVVIHLCTMRSFGVPYLSPLAPMKGRDMKDVLMRAPWWKLNSRPHLTGDSDTYRQPQGQAKNPAKETE